MADVVLSKPGDQLPWPSGDAFVKSYEIRFPHIIKCSVFRTKSQKNSDKPIRNLGTFLVRKKYARFADAQSL